MAEELAGLRVSKTRFIYEGGPDRQRVTSLSGDVRVVEPSFLALAVAGERVELRGPIYIAVAECCLCETGKVCPSVRGAR